MAAGSSSGPAAGACPQAPEAHSALCTEIRTLLQEHHARLSAELCKEIRALQGPAPQPIKYDEISPWHAAAAASLRSSMPDGGSAPSAAAHASRASGIADFGGYTNVNGRARQSGVHLVTIDHPFRDKRGDTGQLDAAANALPRAPKPIAKSWTRTRVESGSMDILDQEDRLKQESVYKHGDFINRSASGHKKTPKDGCCGRCRPLVKSYLFEVFFACMIVSNSILTGVSVQLAADNPSKPTPLVITVIQYVYAMLFLVELVMRLVAGGMDIIWKQWHWLLLDAVIVGGCVLELVADFVHYTTQDATKSKEMSSVRVARIVRITKLIRIMRIARVTRFIRALQTLVYSILCTLRSLVWSLLLLFLIMYVFGILFTQAATDHLVAMGYHDGTRTEMSNDARLIKKYWGSLWLSMLTLFSTISNGVAWYEAADCLQDVGMPLFMLFVFFISFAYFAVLNVVTGVFCQSAIESTAKDREIMVQSVLENKEMYVSELTTLFQNMDLNADGVITLQEFERHLLDTEVQAYMATLEIEARDAWTLFKLLDQDKSHIIDIDEFVLGCMRLKGGARSIDVAKLTYDSRWLIKQLAAFMAYTESQFQALVVQQVTLTQLQQASVRARAPPPASPTAPPPASPAQLELATAEGFEAEEELIEATEPAKQSL